MKARTAGTIVAVITVAFILLVSNASANETNENPIIDTVETVKDKAVNNKVTQFFINDFLYLSNKKIISEINKVI